MEQTHPPSLHKEATLKYPAFGVLASRTVRQYICIVFKLPICGNVMAALRT